MSRDIVPGMMAGEVILYLVQSVVRPVGSPTPDGSYEVEK
jgi:hypothetical protein